MVEETQALDDAKIKTESSRTNNDQKDVKNMEIWGDNMSMLVMNGNQLPTQCEEAEKVKVNKHIMHYYQSNDNLMFKDLVVPRPNECWQLILDLHQEIGHFEKGKTLAKLNKHYFQHNRSNKILQVM